MATNHRWGWEAIVKALRIHRRGDVDGLVYEDAPDPEPVTGDVLVRVHACGFTPSELDWPSTWTDKAGRDRTPSIPGHEVSGEVVAIGYGTTGLVVGQPVFGLTDSYRDGAAAEFVAMEARNLARLPASVDPVHAAALPQAGLAAWQGLFIHGQLKTGQTVLVHGAGGGVGTFAVQLAREAGAHVIGTGRSAVRSIAMDLGAETFIDLDAGPFDEADLQVDLVFDAIGGDVLARSPAVVKPGGSLISVIAPPPMEPRLGRSTFFVLEPDRTVLDALAQQVESGRLRCMIDAVYPLAEGRQAFVAKLEHRIPGKAVLQP